MGDLPGDEASTAHGPLVVVDQVNKHLLKDINLTVDRGEVVVVIGPSGSGKSTLCRAINRLETIDSGVIAIDGAEPRRSPSMTTESRQCTKAAPRPRVLLQPMVARVGKGIGFSQPPHRPSRGR